MGDKKVIGGTTPRARACWASARENAASSATSPDDDSAVPPIETDSA